MASNKYSKKPSQVCSNNDARPVMHMQSFANGFIHGLKVQ